jgi:hypothetical protein
MASQLDGGGFAFAGRSGSVQCEAEKLTGERCHALRSICHFGQVSAANVIRGSPAQPVQ